MVKKKSYFNYRMEFRKKSISLAALLFLFGCNVGSKYEPPISEVPSTWKNVNNESTINCDFDNWWEAFNDPLLNELQKEALERNYTLEIAVNRIQEAKALMKAMQAEFYPHLYLNPKYNNEGVLYESYSDGIIVRSHQVLYLLPFDLSYEADLWGKIRNRYRAAEAYWEGQMQAYRSVQLILSTNVAATYYQLRTIDAQIDLLQETIDNRKTAFKINNSKYKGKLISYSDVTNAGLLLSNAIAEHQEAIRKRAEIENRLAVLIGVPATEFSFIHFPLEGEPPQIPSDIPSEVLLRRPDIAEAERLIAREHAFVNVAYTRFFPSFTLTGVAGYSSPHLRYFLKAFSRLWGFGFDASQMMFDGGKLCAELEAQESRFREANASYQQKVLICFEEVEDALSNVEKLTKEFEEIRQSVEWAKKNYRIANNRYNKGITSYLDVVVSEEQKLKAQLSQNELQGMRFLHAIQLIKALGGGW